MFIYRCSKRESSASEILRCVTLLRDGVRDPDILQHDLLKETIKHLELNFDKYFPQYETDTSLILATFLDPRYKTRFWRLEPLESRFSTPSIKKMLIDAYISIVENTPETNDDADTEDTDEQTQPSTSQLLDDFSGFGTPVPNAVQARNNIYLQEEINYPPIQPVVITPLQRTIQDEIEVEVGVYLNSFYDTENPNLSPFKWWSIIRHMTPHLGKLATKYLCSPPSSVESERLFSIAGLIYTHKRSKLLPENGERLMFINHNIKHFDYNYKF